MNIPQAIRDRNVERLKLVHPDLRMVVLATLEEMERLGFAMCVLAGARTAAEQFELYKKGRKLEAGVWVPIDPVKRTGIVTNADGFEKLSNHQVKPDGWGHAVDCGFLVDGADRDGEFETLTFDDDRPWKLYGEMAKALGGSGVPIVWGGDWKSIYDGPHLELRAA